MTIFSRILLWVPSTWVECYVRGVKKSLRRSIALLGQWSSASSSSSLVILLFPPFLVIILLALTCQNNWTRRGKTHFSYLMVSDVMRDFTRPAITHGCRIHEILHKNQEVSRSLSFKLFVFLSFCLLSCCLFFFLSFCCFSSPFCLDLTLIKCSKGLKSQKSRFMLKNTKDKIPK